MKKQKKLKVTWFMDSPIDLEHKQYVLLDWLQKVNKNFDSLKVYPEINDLKFQLSNLESFFHTREIIINSLSKIKGIDLKKMEVIYELPEDSFEMEELVKIAQWAIPKIEETYFRGRELFRQVETSVDMHYLGIIPEKYVKEGFIFVRQSDDELVHVYEYKIKDIINPSENNKRMLLTKLDSFNLVSGEGYESLKMKISNRFPKYNNPLFLCVESRIKWPLKETLLPVIKNIATIKISKDYKEIKDLGLRGKNDIFNGYFFR